MTRTTTATTQPDQRRELGRRHHAERVDDRQGAEQPAPPAAPHDQRNRDREGDDGKVSDGGGQREQGAPAPFGQIAGHVQRRVVLGEQGRNAEQVQRLQDADDADDRRRRHQQPQAAHGLLTGLDHRAHDDVLRRQLPQHQRVEDVVAGDCPASRHHHDQRQHRAGEAERDQAEVDPVQLGPLAITGADAREPAHHDGRGEQGQQRLVGPHQGNHRPGVHAHDERRQEDQQVRRGRRPGHDQAAEEDDHRQDDRVLGLDARQRADGQAEDQQRHVDPAAPGNRPAGPCGACPATAAPARAAAPRSRAARSPASSSAAPALRPGRRSRSRRPRRSRRASPAPGRSRPAAGRQPDAAVASAGPIMMAEPATERSTDGQAVSLPRGSCRTQVIHQVRGRGHAAEGKGEAKPGQQGGPVQLQGGDDAARAHDRLDDHPAQRIAGVLARVAGVRASPGTASRR